MPSSSRTCCTITSDSWGGRGREGWGGGGGGRGGGGEGRGEGEREREREIGDKEREGINCWLKDLYKYIGLDSNKHTIAIADTQWVFCLNLELDTILF